MESTRHNFTLTLALAAVLVGCGSPPKETEAAAAASTAAETASTPAAPPDGVAVITKFGVPECDAYVAKYMACVEGKVTGEAKQQLLATFEANQKKWRAMSTMKEAALALGLACKASAQKAKEELAVEYGCEF